MSTSDKVVFTKSLEPEMPDDIMSSRLLSYVQDLNSGSYSGGIVNLDSSTLSSNNRWIDWRSAYIEIPFTVCMKASTDISASANGYMAGLLKSGHWNLINYLTVDFQNTNIVQQTQFLNFYVNYKVMTSWSQDVQRKYGASTGMEAIDTSTSFRYSAAASADGNGICNNRIASSGADTFNTSLENSNSGLLTRAYSTSYGPVTGIGGLPIQGGSTTWNQNVGQNYYTTTGAGAATIYCWHVLATIRLRDVCDFFEKVPMLKKGFFKFTIGYNSVQSMSITTTTGPTMVMAANPTLVGNTNPIMVTSSVANNPLNSSVTAAANTFTYSSGIASATLAGTTVSNPFLTSCRLYAYSYLFTPEYEVKYAEIASNKEIIYDDVYNYNVIGIQSNQNFNNILTNTVVNPSELVIIPMINSASNGTAQLIPYQSPFDTAPCTTCPLAQIYNFQVILSGENLWQAAQLYDFDQFQSEFSKDGDCLLGGQDDQLSSGLIGMRQWQFGYRFYLSNLGRRLQLCDAVPRSVQISGRNNSSVVMDLYTFTIFKKVMKLNLLSGELSLGTRSG